MNIREQQSMEIARLRERVAELEVERDELRTANTQLNTALTQCHAVERNIELALDKSEVADIDDAGQPLLLTHRVNHAMYLLRPEVKKKAAPADEPITAAALKAAGWTIRRVYVGLTGYIHPQGFVWVCIDEEGCIVVASDDKSSGSLARGCTTMRQLHQLVELFTAREVSA